VHAHTHTHSWEYCQTEPLVSRRKQRYPSWGKCQGRGVRGYLTFGLVVGWQSRRQGCQEIPPHSSICGPKINRRNSAGISARSKCSLLPSSIHTHGPRQKSAAAGRFLSWQQGWGKNICSYIFQVTAVSADGLFLRTCWYVPTYSCQLIQVTGYPTSLLSTKSGPRALRDGMIS